MCFGNWMLWVTYEGYKRLNKININVNKIMSVLEVVSHVNWSVTKVKSQVCIGQNGNIQSGLLNIVKQSYSCTNLLYENSASILCKTAEVSTSMVSIFISIQVGLYMYS